VEAVLYRYRAGMPWRDLPERFGDPIKIHTRFSRWAKSGVWKKTRGRATRQSWAFDRERRWPCCALSPIYRTICQPIRPAL
jgi:transposase